MSMSPAGSESCVTIHMAASLDGFMARSDGSVDWMETSDEFENGEPLEPDTVAQFLRTIAGGAGRGNSFFQGLDRTVPLHLLEVKACRSGIVALRHQVRK